MKYFAHYGHKDFILCLGCPGDLFKEYFPKYDECMSNDFVLTQGGAEVKLANSDIADWKITFADMGLRANIGQRLASVQEYLEDEELFMANYTDGLTDLKFPEYLDYARKSRSTKLLSQRNRL